MAQRLIRLVLNGSEFVFLKLVQDDVPPFALSNLFSLLNRGNDLYHILRVLKRLKISAMSSCSGN